MSLWQKVLQEATQNSKHQEGNLILAGGARCGVKTLLQKLRLGPAALGRASNYSQLIAEDETYEDATCPIHYFYLNAKNIEDPQSDKISRVNVWCIEHPEHKDLLDMALTPKGLKRTIFGVVLDWEQPWRFVQDLSLWLDIWHEKLGKAMSGLGLEEQDEMVSKVREYVRTYQEVDAEELTGDVEALPLTEGVLQVNMGVPIFVICCKADLVHSVDSNKEQNDKVLDFVLKTLREQCLTYGASLIYTSAKEETNLKVFYDYLMHRIYGFKFPHKAQIINREEIFIPAGWDSLNLIREMDYQGISDKQYVEMLPKPKVRVVATEEIKTPSDHEFLMQMKQKLETGSRSARRAKDSRPVERPNPGGDINPSEISEAPTQSQHALEAFYNGLLKRGRDST